MKKNQRNRPAKAAFGGVILASSMMLGHAQSTIIFNSLKANSNYGPTIQNAYVLGEVQYVAFAQSFTVGATNQTLDSVTLNMAQQDGGGDLQVALFSNSGGTIGSELAVLSGNNSPTTETDYGYTPSSPVTLSASTTYWITVADLGGSLYNADDFVEGYRWYFGTLNAGSDIGELVNEGGGWFVGDDIPVGTEVTGTPAAAPEPGTVALGALGAAALAVARRRKT